MLPPAGDRPRLATVLEQLSGAVEELLLGGLTTASDSTRQTIAVAIQEAARFRLLRLGSTLRATSDELGRFIAQDPAFSRRRLTFFLNRAWLLSGGLNRALRSDDEPGYDRLAWSPPTRPLESVEAACLGVVKKVAVGSFVAFEFRLRATVECGPVAAGHPLTWSAVYPIKPGSSIPPEGFLHLAQKQKFVPLVFLDRKVVAIARPTISEDDSGVGRIGLTEASTVRAGGPFSAWERFLDWSPAPALERLAGHQPGPLDLDNELQEEVVLHDYVVGPPAPGDEPGQDVYPVEAGALSFVAPVGPPPEGKALRASLDHLRKLRKNRPPLFGLMHYERCRLVFQPLSTFGPGGPEYLTISQEIVDKAALLKAISFT